MNRKNYLKTNSKLRRKTPLLSKSKEKSKFEISEIKVRRPIGDKKKHTDDLDKVFQFYIRLRDSIYGGSCRCISCGRVVPFDKIQAGHFRSRKHMSTRWSELNVHGECFTCNCMDGDHLLDYRRNLIRKIGEHKVQWIESYCHETKKWSDFEIVLMIKEYSKKCIMLSEEKGIPLSTTIQRIIKKYNK